MLAIKLFAAIFDYMKWDQAHFDGYDRVVEKEYYPDQVGERIGWVNLQRIEADPSHQYLIANIATATISEVGAVAYKLFRNGQELANNDSAGFSAVRGLSLTLEKKDKTVKLLDVHDLQGDYRRGSSNNHILSGRWMHDPEAEQRKVWAHNSKGVIEITKRLLDGMEIPEYYPPIYYNLNGHLGHPAFQPEGADEFSPSDLMMPDPDMSPSTREQIRIAHDTVEALESVDGLDKFLSSSLTVFSDIKPGDIARIFENIRRDRVSKLERQAMSSFDSYFGHFIYLPIGFRPKGRTWPYMDATATDSTVAYGRELNAIREHDVEPAMNELGRERAELVHRISFARDGQQTLQTLLQAEKTAAA